MERLPYELAKELKDAGFPQAFAAGMNFYYSDNDKAEHHLWLKDALSNDNIPHCTKKPTLSELIEACGEEFDALFSGWEDIHKGYRDKDKQWRADATNRTGYSCAGSTPEEAVARLWLALNVKPQHSGSSDNAPDQAAA